MRCTHWLSACALYCLATTATAAAQDPGPVKQAPPRIVVHEWGTFLSVQGSDGVSLGGMVESDEVLPGFVESRGIKSWDRCMWLQKMETPVTFFYVDKPCTARVLVDMPQGLLTHWFPMVHRYGPPLAQPKPGAEKPRSFILWNQLQLTPPEKAALDKLPAVGADQPWRFSRETDAAVVTIKTKDDKNKPIEQHERFLFYRGLGTFPLSLEVKTHEDSEGQAYVDLKNLTDAPLTGVYLVSVDQGHMQFAKLPDLPATGVQPYRLSSALGERRPLAEAIPAIKDSLARSLTEAGLYHKEALSMVNTWEKSYFHTDGLRLLYVLPRKKVNEVIPIKVEPKPTELVRVMVGRVEVLTPRAERQIEGFIRELGSSEFKKRDAATAGISRLGRIGEPALRRVLNSTRDPEVRNRARQLLSAMTPLN